MQLRTKTYELRRYWLYDDGRFPNNKDLPVLHYRQVLQFAWLFPSRAIKKLFKQNHWDNPWTHGLYTYHHYHRITHEVVGIYKGSATLQLGGVNGICVVVSKGDVLIIPAGVAHKNLETENSLKRVGAYPNGFTYDMNYGRPGEWPQTDLNIASLPVPERDPVFGFAGELQKYWKAKINHPPVV